MSQALTVHDSKSTSESYPVSALKKPMSRGMTVNKKPQYNVTSMLQQE